MENVYWSGYSNEDRYSAINTIQHIVSKFSNIVDYKLFSDMSLAMKIEIMEVNVDKLYEELLMHIGMDKTVNVNSISERERTLYLNIVFAQGTGTLNIAVPEVPG